MSRKTMQELWSRYYNPARKLSLIIDDDSNLTILDALTMLELVTISWRTKPKTVEKILIVCGFELKPHA